MVKTAHGIVHGKMIELDEDLGIAEGQQVEIQVRVVERVIEPVGKWGDGLGRCAGALAGEWTEEDDRILEEIHEDRKRDTRPEIALTHNLTLVTHNTADYQNVPQLRLDDWLKP